MVPQAGAAQAVRTPPVPVSGIASGPAVPASA